MWWHHKLVARTLIDELPLIEGELARVVGRAVSLGEELETPHTARKCLAVCSSIEQVVIWSSSTDGGPRVKGPDLLVRFAVEDGAGRIVVRPQALELELELEVVLDERSGPSADPNRAPQFGASIIKRELDSVGTEGARNMCREGVLAAGDVVAIIGRVERCGDGWELVGAAGEPLIVSTHAAQLV
jgi:hypothetical protein